MVIKEREQGDWRMKVDGPYGFGDDHRKLGLKLRSRHQFGQRCADDHIPIAARWEDLAAAVTAVCTM
jgi:hypothetical protein